MDMNKIKKEIKDNLENQKTNNTQKLSNYTNKLKHFKKLYLLDKEMYGEEDDLLGVKSVLNEFINYVELRS